MFMSINFGKECGLYDNKKSAQGRADLVDLALLFLDFVAAEVFLGLGEDDMFPENWVVLPEGELIGGIHSVLLCVVLTNTGLFGDEAD